MNRNDLTIWIMGLIVLLFAMPVISPARPIFNHADTLLVLNDPLSGSSLGKVTGGQFLSSSGWKVSDPSAMIFYDLQTYISNGSLEITVTNFDPRCENTFKRHHVISMYTNKWGEHHQIELLNTDWNFHTGFNYQNGVKLQSATYEDDRRVVIPWDSLHWELNQDYQLKFVWKGGELRFFRNGSLISTTKHPHNFLLRYIYLGRDRTISGDYITNFNHQQYQAMVGPIFSNLVVKKFLSDTVSDNPQLESFFISENFGNATRLRWHFSEPVISKLIYRKVNAVKWDSTCFFEIPRQDFEYVVTGLSQGKKYEARVIFKNNRDVQSIGEPLYFRTRATDLFLFEPVQDSFTEDKDIIGPYRNIANMGWLYLMVGRERNSFLRFSPVPLQETARKSLLRMHIRNVQGKITSLYVKRALSDWDENTITLEKQPNIQDTCLSVLTSSGFAKGDWIAFPLGQNCAIDSGLNIAIISPDNGWLSLDSRDSFDGQPELIIDYRRTYIFNGHVFSPEDKFLNGVRVTIRSSKDSTTVYSGETIVTDLNGYFETSLNLGDTYKIDFVNDAQTDDIKAISIYDAYLTVAMALGLVEQKENTAIAADANGDGKISVYDALLIAKASVGLDANSMVGDWHFPKLQDLSNETKDTLSVSEKGILIGDVDFSWPNPDVHALALTHTGDIGQFQITEDSSKIGLNFPDLQTKNLASFSIDVSFNPDALKFKKFNLPTAMRDWFSVKNIQKGRLRLAIFQSKKSLVNLKDFKVFFSEIQEKRNFKIVVRHIQIDNRVYSNILLTGVKKEKREHAEDYFSVYPNPFNQSTSIQWRFSGQIPEALYIFNGLGQLVFSKQIATGNDLHSFIWKGKNNQNSSVSSGIYYVFLKTNRGKFGQKLLLLK